MAHVVLQAGLAHKTQMMQYVYACRSRLEAEHKKIDLYLAARQEDCKAVMRMAVDLKAVQDEAQEVMANANTLSPAERKQLVHKMRLQWHPGEPYSRIAGQHDCMHAAAAAE